MKRILNLLLLVLALILLAEEWLWDWLKRQMHRLSALPAVQTLEQVLRSLPPWGSLAVLLTPALVLLPFKFAAMWALYHGHAVLGVTVLITAKLVGTAAAAYLFDLVRDNARKIATFDRIYRAITGALRACHAWVQRQAAYQQAQQLVQRIKATLRARLRRRSRLARRLRAAKVVGKRYRCCLLPK